MIVDEWVKDRVHEALRAAAARDSRRLLDVLHELDPSRLPVAVGYGRFICASVMWDAYPKGPRRNAVRGTAHTVVESESWIDLGGTDDVAALLASTWTNDGPTAGPPTDPMLLALFVCALSLLDEHRAKGERWWEYLDDIWARLAALPG